MLGSETIRKLTRRLRGRRQDERKKYCCPVCSMGADDPQDVFHHISQVHVLKEIPAEVLNVSNDADDELQKVYTNLVYKYKTNDRIIMAIADLQDISTSEKVLLGYVLGRNASIQRLVS
jgi:hypothetical protein